MLLIIIIAQGPLKNEGHALEGKYSWQYLLKNIFLNTNSIKFIKDGLWAPRWKT